jgi:GTPase SAR1 family protein
MDSWRIALLGDGGVGKTALAVQVSEPYLALRMADSGMQFSLDSFVG